ncbi:unnamed protein product [Bursaphelenchus okinawaensis]|uniref:Fibronectin type-III domain-containing protein n=1 Tax=Bursaphelenchus okinawaensis TaxID=465554 RepID=A0A811LDF5_9BILA|nr:unnamed protein product [Bursaphelenchus okinawaensis]CAG9121888.1 unnamed protein product [Bursaphelenchus okinawaensis]
MERGFGSDEIFGSDAPLGLSHRRNEIDFPGVRPDPHRIPSSDFFLLESSGKCDNSRNLAQNCRSDQSTGRSGVAEGFGEVWERRSNCLRSCDGNSQFEFFGRYNDNFEYCPLINQRQQLVTGNKNSTSNFFTKNNRHNKPNKPSKPKRQAPVQELNCQRLNSNLSQRQNYRPPKRKNRKSGRKYRVLQPAFFNRPDNWHRKGNSAQRLGRSLPIRVSRSRPFQTMLLPWSSTAEKLASGRQTPATLSPHVTAATTPNGLYQFTDITPGQFGLTKQLVLRITLPHISLLLVSIGYALAGCWILTAINYNADSVEAMDLITDTKEEFLLNIKSGLNQNSYDSFNKDMDKSFTSFASKMYNVYSRFPRSTAILETARIDNSTIIKGPLTNVTWNLFFVTTTLTSIGYGANAPDSLVGRLFCIIYILFGIPLYLITLADLAKFCTEGMNRSYTEYLKVKHSVQTKFSRWRRRRENKDMPSKGSDESESFDIERVIIAGGEDEVAEFLWTHLENTQFVEIPFVLIYIILLSYITAASYLIAHLENWSTQKGFYFVMMSVLTIGFGDVVPSKDRHVLLILFIIILGLIITTTCIDIVGAYYIDQLHFFGRRIDVEDPLLWLKIVQQKRINAMKREAMRKLFETVAALNRLHFDPASFHKQISTDDPELAITKLTEITGEPSTHFRNSIFPEPPPAPTNLKVSNPTAESILLRWDAPVMVEEAKRYWYTLSYKTRTPQRRPNATVIDFVNQTYYEITDLKSFTLYEFSVATTTRYGSSKAVKCQEYTEPCTVPQSLKLDAIGAEKATISWRAPRKNKSQEFKIYPKKPVFPSKTTKSYINHDG